MHANNAKMAFRRRAHAPNPNDPHGHPRHRPGAINMNAFFGTCGSPIKMSSLDTYMDKRDRTNNNNAANKAADKENHANGDNPAAATENNNHRVAARQDFVVAKPREEQPPPLQSVSSEAATVNPNARKDLAMALQRQKQEAKAQRDAQDKELENIATIRKEPRRPAAGGAGNRGRRGSTEFLGAPVEPMAQMRLDGAKKAKIPHFMSAWFNNQQPNDQDKDKRNGPEEDQQTIVNNNNGRPNNGANSTEPMEIEESQASVVVSNATATAPMSRTCNQNINFNELTLGRLIGEGAFGKVHEGKWRGRSVAIKLLICQELRNDILTEFESEVKIMSVLRHPNICRLLGACMEPPHRALVVELLQRGSLWGVLRSNRRTLNADMRTRFLYDTAKGMSYLHHFERPILHRDLKSPNLLVDKNYNIKISDFGLARVRAHVQTMTGNCGTVQWMAPEVLANQKYTEKADVFSFGIVVWEVMTGECPYDGMSQIQTALGVLNRNLRPNVPRDCPPFFARLMKTCWNRQPEMRPSFPHIVNAFRTYQNNLSDTKSVANASESRKV